MPASIPTTVSVVSPKTIGQWQQTAAEDAAVSRRRAAVEGPDFPTPGRGVNTEIGQARSTEVLAGAAWDQFDTQAGQVRRSVYIPDSTSDRNFGEAQDGAMLALLLGSGLRRSEVVGLRLDQLQLREDHWVIVDLVGKCGRVRRSSLFPPENATGNYVKIVQWLPVRIRFKPNQRDLDKLRPGESVEPKVHLD
jgi:hypothetical protein